MNATSNQGKLRYAPQNIIINQYIIKLNNLLAYEITPIVGFLLLFFGILLPNLYIELYGIDVTAVVTNKYMMQGVHTFGPFFDLLVFPDNHQQILSVSTDMNTYNTTSIGDHIEIVYSNSYNVAALPGHNYLDNWVVLIGSYAILVVYEAILFRKRLQLRNFVISMKTHGQIIYGKVTKVVERKLITKNPKWSHSLTAKYEFMSPQTQKTLRGKYSIYVTHRSIPADLPQIGTDVTIFYVNDGFYRTL